MIIQAGDELEIFDDQISGCYYDERDGGWYPHVAMGARYVVMSETNGLAYLGRAERAGFRVFRCCTRSIAAVVLPQYHHPAAAGIPPAA